jgi:hypothetical protein
MVRIRYRTDQPLAEAHPIQSNAIRPGHGMPCPYNLRPLRSFDFAQDMPLRLKKSLFSASFI